ncbi:MAG: MFS transporter [Acidobacteriia bacterium]|nr:MFS transporter [Terriglobia bacterium]
MSPSAYWRLVRGNRNFRRLWLAQIVSEIGDWFYTVTLYTLLLQFTGRAQSVGLALVLQVLPQTLVGPSAGVVNDRVRRKRVMITADLLRAGIVLSMLLVRSRSTVWLIYPLLVMETVAAAFFEPARNSVIPNITRREEVIVANTLSSITWSFDLAVGATLGGIVAVFLGREAVFILNALSFVASALLIGGMRFHEPHAAGLPRLRPREVVDFSPMMEGLRYLQDRPRLLATVLVKGGLGLMIGATWIIYTILGEREFSLRFGGSAGQAAMLGMGVLIGARGIGALLGPLIGATWAGQRDSRLRRGILFGFIAAACGVGSISVAPNVWIAMLCVIVAHCGGSIIWTFSTTLLQLYSDDQFRGRVFSADLGICMATISLTAWAASAAIDAAIPVRLLAAITGAAILIPAGAWALAQRFWKSSLSVDSSIRRSPAD